MEKTKFKVGDRVRVIGNKSKCGTFRMVEGDSIEITEVVVDSDYEYYKYNIFKNGVVVDDCFACFKDKDLELISSPVSKPSKPITHILRYELDQDPIEEFESLAQVKKRIKELLTNLALKKDSLVVYELKKKLEVKISNSVIIK